MADNCGMCHALHEKYGCGWCQSSDRCEVKEQCDGGTNGPRPWLDSNQTCPQVEIKEFFPMLGPWEGGTNITIRGVNLGKSYGVDSGRAALHEAGAQPPFWRAQRNSFCARAHHSFLRVCTATRLKAAKKPIDAHNN